MEMWIEECPLEEWAEKASKITSFQGDIDSFIAANIFSSMQFVDEEAVTRKRHRAFRLHLSDIDKDVVIAWLSIYYISDSVLRLRGLYVVEEHRGKGAMSFLLRHVLEKFEGHAQKVISFGLPTSSKFHLQNGFMIEHRFKPRPTYRDPSEVPLTLFYYNLGGSSFKS